MPARNIFKKYAFLPSVSPVLSYSDLSLLSVCSSLIISVFHRSSAHYWFLSGVFLAGAIYGPWNGAPRVTGTVFDSTNWLACWTALWAVRPFSSSPPFPLPNSPSLPNRILYQVSELINLSAHWTLRSLRPAGTKTRGIPRGGLFEYVSCPNYFAETLAWGAITAMTASPFGACLPLSSPLVSWGKGEVKD